MTPLGFNTAAAAEAAALFPVSAAIPPAAEASSANGGAASTAFGDLLAASFGEIEQPNNGAVAKAGAASSALSMADMWFAALKVDLTALNAGLDAEDTEPSRAQPAAVAAPVADLKS